MPQQWVGQANTTPGWGRPEHWLGPAEPGAIGLAWGCDGEVAMLDGAGAERWRRPLSVEHEARFDARQVSLLLRVFSGGPRKGHGMLFVGFNRFAMALDAASGERIWLHSFDQSSARGPVSFACPAESALVYVAAKGKVKGIFADDGAKKWSRELPDGGHQPVSLRCPPEQERLVAGCRGSVCLLDGGSGLLVWRTEVKSPLLSSSMCSLCLALCDNAAQIVYGTHGRLGGLGTDCGSGLWQRKLAKLECSDTAVPLLAISGSGDGGRREKELLVAAAAGVVYCTAPRRRQAGGELMVWERDLRAGIRLAIEQPGLAEAEQVLFVSLLGHCLGIDPWSGEILWATHLPELSSSMVSLTVTNQKGVLAAGAVGRVQLLDSSTGRLMDTLLSDPRVSRNTMLCLAGHGFETEHNSCPLHLAAVAIEALGPDYRGVAPKRRGDISHEWQLHQPLVRGVGSTRVLSPPRRGGWFNKALASPELVEVWADEEPDTPLAMLPDELVSPGLPPAEGELDQISLAAALDQLAGSSPEPEQEEEGAGIEEEGAVAEEEGAVAEEEGAVAEAAVVEEAEAGAVAEAAVVEEAEEPVSPSGGRNWTKEEMDEYMLSQQRERQAEHKLAKGFHKKSTGEKAKLWEKAAQANEQEAAPAKEEAETIPHPPAHPPPAAPVEEVDAPAEEEAETIPQPPAHPPPAAPVEEVVAPAEEEAAPAEEATEPIPHPPG